MSSDVLASSASLASSFEGTNNNDEEDRKIMLRQFAGAFVFALVAWYGPRYLIFHETLIENKPAPYQKTAAGDIILDPSLNEVLLPQTIPCTYVGFGCGRRNTCVCVCVCVRERERDIQSSPLFLPTMIYAASLLVHASVTLPICIILLAPWWNRCLCDVSSSSSSNNSAIFRPLIALLFARGGNNNNNSNPDTSSVPTTALWQMQGRLCAFFTAVGLSEGTTQLLKLIIQRRRPNFYALCGFDVATLKCTSSDIDKLREANFSFPSGHSSLTSCAMTFLMWLGLSLVVAQAAAISNNTNKRQQQQQRSSWFQLSRLESLQCRAFCVVMIPASWTLFVAASRLVDKWHHPSDILAGLVLGFVMATVGYHLWFPPLVFYRGSSSSVAFISVDYPWSVHMIYQVPMSFPPPSMLSSFND